MLLEATIEEFEHGTWVAQLVQDSSFIGTFGLPDGSTWVGTQVSEIVDRGRHFVTVVGGKNGLGKKVVDQFYDGQVSLQAAVQQICSSIGETFGGATTAVFLTQYQRQEGTGAEVLDKMADVFSSIWWIGRDGLLQMQALRPAGGPASGTQDMNTVDVDGSVDLIQPSGCVLGGIYNKQSIRHIRWKMTPDRFCARLFFVPFIFKLPTNTKYASMYNALVESDNGDGTVNVIADSRFGVTRAPLFCGVPGSKVQTRPGEQVMLGFWGGDPQKPFCVAMAQDVTAIKQVARVNDLVQLDPGATIIGSMAIGGPPGPVLAPGPITVTITLNAPAAPGKIVSGSARLMVGD